jgi:hypothetical protein
MPGQKKHTTLCKFVNNALVSTFMRRLKNGPRGCATRGQIMPADYDFPDDRFPLLRETQGGDDKNAGTHIIQIYNILSNGIGCFKS